MVLVVDSSPVLGTPGVVEVFAATEVERDGVEERATVAPVLPEPEFTASDTARLGVTLENCVVEFESGTVGITALPPVLAPRTAPAPPGITVCPSGGPPAIEPLPLPPTGAGADGLEPAGCVPPPPPELAGGGVLVSVEVDPRDVSVVVAVEDATVNARVAVEVPALLPAITLKL